MVRDTPSHGSDHLCLIWKESIHNCRWYGADTACGTDGRTDGRTEGRTDGRTDGQTDGRSETSIPPQQLEVEKAVKIITEVERLSSWLLDCHSRHWGMQQSNNQHRSVNTLWLRSNRRHFADKTSKRIFLNENNRISNKITLKFVP